MVVYCKRIGFVTALILLIIQMPLNFMGMISRHDLSALPGIFIKNTTYISVDKEVYAALTGDQVALTDIRVIR